MALSPFQENDERYVIAEREIQPSRTYCYNFETGAFEGIIDGKAALKQAIVKALRTNRFRCLAYSSDYGSELHNLIGGDYTIEFLQAEVPRMVKEALLYDERIEDIQNIELTQEGNQLLISFFVITNEENIYIEGVEI